MDQRLQFVTDALSDRFTMTELCERYGVSRRIGYKWLARFNENGAHERMHRTMKRRAVKPVQRTRAAQQTQFDAFRLEYNTERPHDALGGDTPASRSAASPRPYPERPPVPEYPGHFLVKRVTDAGTFRFQHRLLSIANALVNQHIGLEETADGVWAIYFTTVRLATLDERDFVIRG
jgi:transposase-like protein